MASGNGTRDSATVNNSQSEEKPVPGSNSNCHKCEQTDSIDDMVCCDNCSSWEHFQCAGVTESIANPDRSWKCNRCLSGGEGTKSSVSFNESSVSKSSKKSQRLHLSLLLLEKQQELKRKQMEEEEAFLKEKFRLLMEIHDAEGEDSRKSGVSSKSNREDLASWLKRATEGDTGVTKPQPTPRPTPQKQQPAAFENGATVTAVEVVANEQSSTKQTEHAEPTLYLSVNPVPVNTVATSSDSSWEEPLIQLNSNAALLEKTPTSLGTFSRTGVVAELTRECDWLSAVDVLSSRPHSGGKSTMYPGPSLSAAQQLGSYSEPLYTMEPLLHSAKDTSGGRTNYIRPPLPPVVPPPLPVPRSAPMVPQTLQSTSTAVVRTSVGTQSHNQLSLFPTGSIVSGPVEHRNVPRTLARTSSVPVMNPSNRSHPYLEPKTLTVPTLNMMHHVPGLTSSERPVPPKRDHLPFVPCSTFTPAPAVQPCVPQTQRVPVVELPFGACIATEREPFSSYLPPTNAQLAARQVMPRELPKFNGDPRDWPIFHSSFKNTTEICGYSDAENLARLQRSLSGPALEVVRSRLLLPKSVTSVIETLRKFYGRPDILIHSLLRQVRCVPPPKQDNLNSIVAYGLAIQNFVDYVVLSDQQAHLCNPMLLQELVDKLPTSLKMQWGVFKRSYGNVNLATFNRFMEELVNVAADLSLDAAQITSQAPHPEKHRQREKLFIHSQQSSPEEDGDSPEYTGSNACSYCSSVEHQILNCNRFIALDMNSRWKAVRQKNLCRTCLVTHRQWPCRSKKECGLAGCNVRHHKLLHSNYVDTSPESSRPIDSVHLNYHACQGTTESYAMPQLHKKDIGNGSGPRVGECCGERWEHCGEVKPLTVPSTQR